MQARRGRRTVATPIRCRDVCRRVGRIYLLTPRNHAHRLTGLQSRSDVERGHRHRVEARKRFRMSKIRTFHKTALAHIAHPNRPAVCTPESSRRQWSSRPQPGVRPWTPERSDHLGCKSAMEHQRQARKTVTTRTWVPTSRASSTSPSIVSLAMSFGSLRFEMSYIVSAAC